MERLDTLLEQYLGLLDEYQKTKTRLHDDLAAGYLSLARANFASSGRARYGQDYYDERMHATRILKVIGPEEGRHPDVKVVQIEEKENAMAEKPAQASADFQEGTNGEDTKLKQQRTQKQVGGMVIGAEEVSDLAEGFSDLNLSKTTAASTTMNSGDGKEHDEAVSSADPGPTPPDSLSSATNQKNEKNRPDPIHMFGVLVPQALRQAQGSFVKAVVEGVPRLVELDTEMRELEIEIRRTRKMLTKQV